MIGHPPPAPPAAFHRSAPERPKAPAIQARAAISAVAALAAGSLYGKLAEPRKALPPNWLKISLNAQR
jgi:hypothetical protein